MCRSPALGKTHLTCGMSSSCAIGAQPLPLSPSPWSQITVAACMLLAGTTIYVCVCVCVCVNIFDYIAMEREQIDRFMTVAACVPLAD